MGHANDLYRTLFKDSKEAIFIVNEKGKIADVNDAFMAMIGYAPSTIKRKTINDLVPDKDEFDKLVTLLAENGSVKDYPMQVRRKNGVLDTLSTINVRYDEDGRICNYLGIIRDVTAQKEAETRLQERQLEEKILAETNKEIQAKAQSISFLNKMAAILHESLDFDKVINMATDLLMTYVNADAAALLTFDETTDTLNLLVGKGFSEKTMQVGSQLPLEGSLSGLALQQKRTLTIQDIGSDERGLEKVRKHLAKDGLQSVISVPLLYQDRGLGVINILFKEDLSLSHEERETLLAIGRTIALAMSNAQYVSEIEKQNRERRRAREALQESEQRLTHLIQQSPLAVIEWNLDFEVRGWNLAAEAIFGHSREEAVGQHARFIIPQEFHEHVDAVWEGLVTQTGGSRSTNGNITADGRLITCEWYNTPLVDDDGQVFGVVSLVQDITEQEKLQHQLQETLEQRNKQLEISAAVTQAQGVEDVLQTMADQLDHHPNVAVTITLLEMEGDSLADVSVAHNAHESGLTLAPIGTRRVHNQNPLAAYYDENRSFVSNNLGADDRLSNSTQRAFKKANINGMAVLPITAGGEWLGNMTLLCQEVGFFNDQTLTVYRSIAEQGATAVRAARLYAEVQSALERREREVSLSTQIAQEIASATDLSDLYQRVVTQIQEQFGYYHTQLLRYDPAMETMALAVGYGNVGEEMLALHHSVPIGVGIIGKAAASGQSVLQPNLANDGDWRPNPLFPDAKGELAVPIKLGNDVLGVLDVQSDTVNALNENDQLVLEGLCGQIAVAIESTTLRQDMEARLRELNVLQRQMSREGWQEYKMVKARANGYQYDHAGTHALSSEAIAQTIDQGQNGHQNGNQNDTTTVASNGISTSLQVRGEPIGVLGLQDDPERPLSEEDHEFLTAVAKEVAGALEAARLFEQTQDALAEQERLTSELETVAQVSTAASTILEVDALLQAVVDLSKTSFNLYHVHIYLLNETGKKLILKAGAGNVGRLMSLEGREIDIDADSLVARAARTRQGVLENNVRRTIDFLPHPLLPNTRSEMAVPMILGDKLIGVLDLQSDTLDHFSPEDLKIQRTLASQISIAVENARQYAEQVETSTKLRELDQLKSEFLASMSHELRTPLNSIIGFADVLLEGLDGDLNERMEEDVRLIRESGRHLRELIGDILDMSKIESGRMELRYEDIDLRQMAQDIMAANQPLAQAKNLDLYIDLDENILSIPADRTRLRQILINIMGNAIKFTDKGSVSLSMHDKGKHVLIAIRDTGIGIKEENIPVVFEQFRQIDGGLNRAAGGTGLGMPITKKLVELHGGDIWVESAYGQGSTFFFTLPYKPPAKSDTGPLPEPN